MQTDIQPPYHRIQVTCSCGHTFTTGSAMSQDTLRIEVCNQCHPYITGKHKMLDTTGRVEQFNSRFGSVSLGRNE